jgi:hypothetical protein
VYVLSFKHQYQQKKKTCTVTRTCCHCRLERGGGVPRASSLSRSWENSGIVWQEPELQRRHGHREVWEICPVFLFLPSSAPASHLTISVNPGETRSSAWDAERKRRVSCPHIHSTGGKCRADSTAWFPMLSPPLLSRTPGPLTDLHSRPAPGPG